MARQRHDANQLKFNFEQKSFSQQPMTPECAAVIHAHLPPPVLPPILPPVLPPIMPSSQNFDFKTTFPPPRQDAIDAGIFGEDDPDAEAIRSIHHEHANELRCVLADLAAIAEARENGIDPRTGREPRGVAARERLDAFFRTEPARLETRFNSLMEVYADAFGDNAAVQFEAFVRSLHECSDNQTGDHPPMPVPEPLPEAVEKGNFGMEDEHTPVDPSPEEVFAITEHHGEQMVELLEELKSVEDRLADATGERRTLAIAEKDRTLSAYQGLMALYAEDFGEVAARHLVTWAQAQVGVPSLARATHRAEDKVTLRPGSPTPQPAAQYDPGHPWYYLARGDGRPPIPVENIPTSTCDGSFVGKLPRAAAKRRSKLEQLLVDESAHLAGFQENYRELTTNGVMALSPYDRTIAYGGDDELAVASSLALRFNHIAHSKGRVAWLKGTLASVSQSPNLANPKP